METPRPVELLDVVNGCLLHLSVTLGLGIKREIVLYVRNTNELLLSKLDKTKMEEKVRAWFKRTNVSFMICASPTLATNRRVINMNYEGDLWAVNKHGLAQEHFADYLLGQYSDTFLVSPTQCNYTTYYDRRRVDTDKEESE